MNPQIINLSRLTIDGVVHQQIVKISAIGELTFVSLNLEAGTQTEFLLDAVASHELYLAQQEFYRGGLEGGNETS